MADGIWHTVEQGEWLTKIAAKYKIYDWKGKIWEDPNNAGLASRRDPNILHPGDQIFIPAPKQKNESGATEQHHRFKIQRPLDEFHVRILDAVDKPVKNRKYKLKIGKQEFSGTTDGNGEIHEKRIHSNGDHEGTLHLSDIHLFYRISLGNLNPEHETADDDHPKYDGGISGIQMRLQNIGYDPGAIDGVLGDNTKAAIQLFQQFDMARTLDQVTGELDDDTRQAIITKYGS